MGFGKSFDEAFRTALPGGQAAALEAIKEKIKKNDDQRQSGAIFDEIHQRILANAAKQGTSPEELDAMSKKFDKLSKVGFSATEALGVGKMIAPDMFQSEEALAIKQGNLSLRRDLEQDRLETRLKADLNAPLEKGTGVIGISNRNVDLAVKARTLLDQNTDPKTGEIKVPPSAHLELAMSLASLLSPNNQGQVAENIVMGLKQTTAKETLANLAIYLGADPKEIGGSTQSVLKYFRENIDRLGIQNESLRDEKVGSLINQSYSNLEETSRKRISDNLPVSSFKNYLNMTPYKSSVSESISQKDSMVTMTAPDGTKVQVHPSKVALAKKRGLK